MSKNTSANDAVLITNDNVLVQVDGEVHMGTWEYAEKSGVIQAIKQGLLRKAADLLDKAKAITRRSAGVFTVQNSVVYHNGIPVHNVVAQRIVELSDAGLPFAPLVKFLENLLQNPSNRAVQELYLFLENKNLPITADGHFLAYKSVSSDYRSKASGTEPVEVSIDGGKTWNTFTGRIPNDVDSIVRMNRNLVDDVASRTCSKGLHVGALAYSGPSGWYHSTGDKVVVVKVNPRDAVSVPSDHNAQKLRVCQYEVIQDFVGAYNVPLTSATGNQFDGTDDCY